MSMVIFQIVMTILMAFCTIKWINNEYLEDKVKVMYWIKKMFEIVFAYVLVDFGYHMGLHP